MENKAGYDNITFSLVSCRLFISPLYDSGCLVVSPKLTMQSLKAADGKLSERSFCWLVVVEVNRGPQVLGPQMCCLTIIYSHPFFAEPLAW